MPGINELPCTSADSSGGVVMSMCAARGMRLAVISFLALGLVLQRAAPGPAALGAPHVPGVPRVDLRFTGSDSFVEIPSNIDFSLGAAGLTVAVWMRPDALTFPKTEGSLPTEQYVHWLGKGERGQYEWAFRMYSLSTPPGPRQNRISFYVFQPDGGRGCGSYFQDPVTPGEWVQVVGVADTATRRTSIYKNGRPRHSDSYATLTPRAGSAPLRIGTRDFASFFQGAIGSVRVWNRPLTEEEVATLFSSDVAPRHGLKAQFLLNEGSGSVVHDTIRGRDGRVTGAVWERGAHAVGTAIGTSGGGC